MMQANSAPIPVRQADCRPKRSIAGLEMQGDGPGRNAGGGVPGHGLGRHRQGGIKSGARAPFRDRKSVV